MEIFTVIVGFTTVRPIIVDQHFAKVIVATDRGSVDAQLLAAQIVACHSEMPTSTAIIAVEI